MSGIDIHPPPATPASRTPGLWTAVGIVIVAANLRPAVVAVAPLLDQIQNQAGLSSTAASLLTTLPVLCFGALAPLAPRLATRFGIERTVLGALVLLCAGILLRLAPSIAALFVGTAVAGAAIAIVNVMLPGLIKRDFPHRAGLMTGLYTMALSGGAALAAGVTVPLEHASDSGWRIALAGWGAFSLIALLVWLPQRRVAHDRGERRVRLPTSLWRNRLAWQVTLFMGLQSLSYYALTAWLPAYFISHGLSTTTAGFLLSLASVVGIASSAVVPAIAERQADQRLLVVVVSGIVAVALLGLLVAPSWPYLWIVILGFGQGASISLALMMIVLRSPDTAHAAQLSGMAQSCGYLLASMGPLAVGALHDIAGSWTPPMLLLLVLLIPQTIMGLGAGRPALVTDDFSRRSG